ncbi:hypothetical protein BDF19DRAFT_410162 [Syncephalis fuscata]|nr:hypothetical protein BDF19DRAFT_410162 [Syncephalis fuscata]
MQHTIFRLLDQTASLALTKEERNTIARKFYNIQKPSKNYEELYMKSSKALQDYEHDIVSPACLHHGKTCVQNTVRGFLRVLIAGYGVKALGILPALIMGDSKKRWSALNSLLTSDTKQFALFLATTSGLYKGSLCFLRHIRSSKAGNEKEERQNSFIAGTIASLALLLDHNRNRRISTSLLLFTRGMQCFCAWLFTCWSNRRKEWQRKLLILIWCLQKQEQDRISASDATAIRRWALFDKIMRKCAGTAVMVVASIVINYGFFSEHKILPQSYLGFMLTHSGMRSRHGKNAVTMTNYMNDVRKRVTGAAGTVNSRLPTRIPVGSSTSDFVQQHISSNVARLYQPDKQHAFTLCALEHSNTDSCTVGFLNTLLRELPLSAKLYLPLNVIAVLLYSYKKIWQSPLEVFYRIAKGTARSSLFLSAYSLVFYANCANVSTCGSNLNTMLQAIWYPEHWLVSAPLLMHHLVK